MDGFESIKKYNKYNEVLESIDKVMGFIRFEKGYLDKYNLLMDLRNNLGKRKNELQNKILNIVI